MEYTGVKQSEFILLLKFTSRERPQQLLSTLREYVRLAANPAKFCYLFSFDSDCETYNYDLNQEIYKIIGSDKLNIFIYNKTSENKIHAFNRDVENFQLKWDILLNISDDQVPEVKGYDEIIRKAMPADLDHSLWFFDGAQPRINTQECIGYNYYQRDRYIYNPIYKAFYCDNESTEVARKRGKLIKSEQCLVRHKHPGCDRRISEDDLYRRQQKYWNEDKATFQLRERMNFGL